MVEILRATWANNNGGAVMVRERVCVVPSFRLSRTSVRLLGPAFVFALTPLTIRCSPRRLPVCRFTPVCPSGPSGPS